MRAERIVSRLAFVLLLTATGCGDNGAGDQDAGNGPITSIAISPLTAEIAVNATQQFTATASDAGGAPITVTVTWSSSAPGVATIDNSGLATAVAPGVTTISASAAGITGTATLTVTAPGTRLLTVNLSGSGSVTSIPSGIDCGSTCTASFSQSTQVTLTATPTGGSYFAGWSGACTGAGACILTMSSDQTVTATFTSQPALTVSVSGNGSVSSSPGGITCPGTCSAQYPAGTQVTLTATPSGNESVDWTGCTTTAGNICTVTLNASTSVTATFVPPETLSVVVTGDGTVSSSPGGIICTSSSGPCSGSFTQGTAVTLTATPSSSAFAFDGWSGDCTGTSTTCVVTMTSGRSVTATFVPVYTLSVSSSGEGTVASDIGGITCPGTCSASYVSGTIVTLTATPTGGSDFAGWSGACTGTGACILTMSSDQTVTATFTSQPALTVSVSGNGSVSSSPGGISCPGTCSAQYPAGTQVTLTATPSGNESVDWTGCTTVAGNTCTVTLNASTSVTASFVPVYTLSVSSSGEGTVTSDIGGITCPGTCSASYVSGTDVTLSAAPAQGYIFAGWSGDCSGIGACVVSMTAERSVNAAFDGPFDFTVSASPQCSPFQMIAGETRSVPIQVTLQNGASSPVALTVSGLPTGVTANFDSTPVTPTGSTQLVITSTGNATLGAATLIVTGTSGIVERTTSIPIEIRSPYQIVNPHGVALETGGTTALVTESFSGRLLRIDVATRAVTRTLACDLMSPTAVTVESSSSALVTTNNALERVDLDTSAVTTVAVGLTSPRGIALEAGGTALVTDCGDGSCTGRIVRIDLSTGLTTPLQGALDRPQGLALEAGGTTAIVIEFRRVVRHTLATGALTVINSDVIDWFDLALEPDGTTALLSRDDEIVRLTLATGLRTIVARAVPPPSFLFDGPHFRGVAIATLGETALVADYSGKVLRVNLVTPDRTLAPARQSLEVLYEPEGMAREATGDELVTDCGPPSSAPCVTDGRLVRISPTTGIVTAVTSSALGLPPFTGVAIETEAMSALVTAGTTLYRVSLTSGSVTAVATAFQDPRGIAVESSGTTAVVADGRDLVRVDLSTGGKATIAANVTAACCPGLTDVALESSGTALVYDSSGGRILRIDLGTGAVSVVGSGLEEGDIIGGANNGILIEAGGATALVSTVRASGRLLRLDLSTGVFTVLAANLGAPKSIVPAPDGSSYLTVDRVGRRLLRLTLPPPTAPTSVVTELALPAEIVYEAGGATALFLDCGGVADCNVTGRLARLTIATGAVETILSGLDHPRGIAIEAGGGTALITACTPANCANGRLLRVVLASGAASLVATGLSVPQSLAIEPGGASVLVAEQNDVRRVTLADGSMTLIASGVWARQIIVEAGGATALVAVEGEIRRLNVTTGASAAVLTNFLIESFAVEPDGATALLFGRPCFGAVPSFADGLYRLELTTGGLDVVTPFLFQGGHTLALDAAGTSGLCTEARPGGTPGWILSFVVP